MTETVSANPSAMRTYVDGVSGTRGDAYEARTLVVSAYNAFVSALPAGFAAPDRPDVAGPLGRVRDMDEYLTSVADRFARMGAGDGDVVTMDAVLLNTVPYTTAYGETRRERLRARAEEELARIRENIGNGSVDETTAGELTALVGWMRWEIENSDNPEETAADLIDTMGAGDQHEAMGMLETTARGVEDLNGDSWPVQAMQDLAFVVSMGLEDQPERAERWVDQLVSWRAEDTFLDHGAGPNEHLELLGAFVAPNTTTLGLALFDPLWQAEGTPDGGVVDRLFDTTEPLVPMLTTTTTPLNQGGPPANPELANAIVGHLLEGDHFEDFFATPSEGDPNWHKNDYGEHEVPNDLLGQLLVTSVDPSLPDVDRGGLARDINDHYVELITAENLAIEPYYPPEVMHGMAATTQPLLEGWRPTHDGSSRVVLPEVGSFSDANLRTAIGLYGQEDGGVAGLRDAVNGMTTARLADAASQGQANPGEAAALYPLPQDRLTQLGQVYLHVAEEVGQERFQSIVEQVEGGDSNGNAVWSVLSGAAGEFPGGDAMGGIVEAGLIYDYSPEIVGDGNPLAGTEARLTHDLVILNLAARPELATPELLDRIAEAERDGGAAEVARLLHESDLYPAASNGGDALTALRDLVDDQEDEVGLSQAITIGGITDPGDGG